MSNTTTVHFLGLDAPTSSSRALYRRLRALKTTEAIQEPSRYNSCPEHACILIDTVWTEEQLEEWLYKGNLEYDGCFTRHHYRKEDGYIVDVNNAQPLDQL